MLENKGEQMLYKKKNRKLDIDLFKNPTAEYRGTPFWSWNCKVDKNQIDRQIGYIKEMGFGGFHMHSRTGMAIEYLSDKFMDLISYCTDKAQKEEMLAWLYDEDRWPSGSAGGIVTRNPRYRQRNLLFTVSEISEAVPLEQGVESGETAYIACYDVVLDNNGCLSKYRRMDCDEKNEGTKWYAYMTTSQEDVWYNGQTYIDTLNPEAVREFIRITYEKYFEAVGSYFDTTVPAIFTDEPQFANKGTFTFPEDQADVVLPWTPAMEEGYYNTYGESLLDKLPELFWELPDEAISIARYHFHDYTANLFAESFAGQCGKWCEEHGLFLTGHVIQEHSLQAQAGMVGEAMRSYPYFHIPGIDMLCDNIELTTAKQAQSVVHQCGREAMMTELYGVTGWDFDFRGHKFQGDWQAALGATVRVPHLSWVSMEGEAKRDYPASINYQSPWYKEYSYVENHFARINTVMTRGKAIVHVGVIHPIESYWIHWGPNSSTGEKRSRIEERFENIIEWLLKGCIDFDFISEALLPNQCLAPSAPLRVGSMEYDTIIVPQCETLRETTLIRLKEFAKQGGNLIFIGEKPKYIDAIPSDAISELYETSLHIPYDRSSVLKTLDCVREIEIRNIDGTYTDNLIYQLREDTDCHWLFIAHVEKCSNKDIEAENPQEIRLTIHRTVKPTLYNTISGEIKNLPYKVENGKTIIEMNLYAYDSVLLKLCYTNENEYVEIPLQQDVIYEKRLNGNVCCYREEPNVLLLDIGQFALDDETFGEEEEEVLRLTNICREKLGWGAYTARTMQTWAIKEEKAFHTLSMRFCVECEKTFDNISIALENAENAQIRLNKELVPSVVCGYYVDESIKTVKLPSLIKGKNVLEIKIPFGMRTSVEACYLLGEFDTVVRGTHKLLTTPSKTIGFGDISRQGLAFYGGNITYETEVEVPAGDMVIHISHYRGAMVKVVVDGKDCAIVAYPPYNAKIKGISEGKHKISLILYGNRFNTFGSLHDTENARWIGPAIWRTTGDKWCYEYRLRETGILSAPVISVLKR